MNRHRRVLLHDLPLPKGMPPSKLWLTARMSNQKTNRDSLPSHARPRTKIQSEQTPKLPSKVLAMWVKEGLVSRAQATKARKWVALHKKLGPPIAAKIVKALRDGGFHSKAVAEEAAFHLTDWIADLSALNKLFASKRWNNGKARSTLMQFASHAPHHLAAAHLIIVGSPVTDIFQIGAVKGTGRGKRKPGEPYPASKRSRLQQGGEPQKTRR